MCMFPLACTNSVKWTGIEWGEFNILLEENAIINEKREFYSVEMALIIDS